MRLSGVYLAMLTLAFAQIVWAAVFQWETLTGGSNGVIGVWPPPPFDRAGVYFLLTLALAVAACCCCGALLFAPFGYAMRAGRDSPLRAEAIGIDVKRVHWLAFAVAGGVCGVAGGLFAFAKGSISPETIHVGRSIDGLVMVLLGGIQTLSGPIVGASVFALLQDTVMRQTEYWRALLGVIILLLVLVFPGGIAGAAARCGCASEARRVMTLLVGRARCPKPSAASTPSTRFQFEIGAGRVSRHDRPERRRQIDLLQHDQRPARARLPATSCSAAATSPACKPREIWRLGVGRTFQVAATFAFMTVVENVQMALISHASDIFRLWRPAGRAASRARARAARAGRHARRRRPAEPRARLRRRQARRVRHRARQRAAVCC